MIQTVVIPQYPTKIKVSNRRMPKYYTRTDKIPMKYSNNRYTFRPRKTKAKIIDCLWDTEEKAFVVKNKNSLETPRYIPISGNLFYAGIHERQRMAILDGVKQNFRPHIQKLKPIKKFPIGINAKVYTIPSKREWDLDNLWFYIKAFQDLLVHEKIVPNDSVVYITKAPGFEYYPITDLKDRKLVFEIYTDTRNVTNHIMFNTGKIPPVYVTGKYLAINKVIQIVAGDINTGDAEIEDQNMYYTAHIGMGKTTKLNYKRFSEALTKVKYWAFQYNTSVLVNESLGSEYEDYNKDKVMLLLTTNLSDEGIPLIIQKP